MRSMRQARPRRSARPRIASGSRTPRTAARTAPRGKSAPRTRDRPSVPRYPLPKRRPARDTTTSRLVPAGYLVTGAPPRPREAGARPSEKPPVAPSTDGRAGVRDVRWVTVAILCRRAVDHFDLKRLRWEPGVCVRAFEQLQPFQVLLVAENPVRQRNGRVAVQPVETVLSQDVLAHALSLFWLMPLGSFVSCGATNAINASVPARYCLRSAASAWKAR